MYSPITLIEVQKYNKTSINKALPHSFFFNTYIELSQPRKKAKFVTVNKYRYMRLIRLNLLNYKNIEQAELVFSPKINCFLGANGMGKTNLLDAIYFLTFCKSHTGVLDTQIINRKADFTMIQGIYEIENKEQQYNCAIKRGHRKIFRHGKKEYERLSDHIGTLPLVLISPADFTLVTGTSEERRRFIDMIIAQYDKDYLHALIAYNKALLQRNTLLKNPHTRNQDQIQLEIWEQQMQQYATPIFHKRQKMITQLNHHFITYYETLSNATEQPTLIYQTQLLEKELLQTLRQNREKDYILGYTTAGIHKDELRMELDGYPVKKIASQGQSKTYLVALKMAQYTLLAEQARLKPLLLLDDLFDKLDASRVSKIIQLVSQPDFGQIFISDTNRSHIDEILRPFNGQYNLFDVESGKIKQSTE